MLRILFLVFSAILLNVSLIADSYAYVANYNDGTFSVIDLKENTVVATLFAHPNPSDLYLSENQDYLFVSNSGVPSLMIYNTSNNTPYKTLAVGTNLSSVAVLPFSGLTGYDLIVGASSLGVVRCYIFGKDLWPPYEITSAEHNFGSGISSVSPIPGQNGFCFSLIDNSSVSVLDISLSGATLKGTTSVGSEPQDAGITPDGKFAYVPNTLDTDHSVSVVDLGSVTTVATIYVGEAPNGAAVTPKGDYAYVTNSFSGNLSVIEVASHTVVGTITVGGSPSAIAISSDSQTAYVTNTSTNSVNVVNLCSKEVVATIPTGQYPIAIVIKK